MILNQISDVSIADSVDTCRISGNTVGAYIRGARRPHYQLPAIPVRVVIGAEYMYDTLYIETADDREDQIILALWDFNFDRCMDFGTPFGTYQYWECPCLSTRGGDAPERRES